MTATDGGTDESKTEWKGASAAIIFNPPNLSFDEFPIADDDMHECILDMTLTPYICYIGNGATSIYETIRSVRNVANPEISDVRTGTYVLYRTTWCSRSLA